MLPLKLRGAELGEFYRGARMMALGGAFVAVADDEQMLYLNPAGLAGVKNLSIYYGSLDVDVADDFIKTASDLSDATADFNVSSVNALIGNNYYLRAQHTPTLLMPHFGISILNDAQVGFFAKNQSYPNWTLGAQVTNGLQIGYGTSVSHFGRTRSRRAGNDLRVGAAVKVMWRRGGYYDIPTSTFLQFSQISQVVKDMVGDYEFGLGVDLGAQYLTHLSKYVLFSAGVAFQDVGGTNYGGNADPQDGNLSLGLALSYEKEFFKFTTAFDYRHALADTDWRKKTHLGFELDFLLFSLYAGSNQTHLTYGASFDVWLLKLYLTSYAEEMGAQVGQDPNRRYMLRLDMRFTL